MSIICLRFVDTLAVCMFVFVDTLHPSQHFFSHLRGGEDVIWFELVLSRG